VQADETNPERKKPGNMLDMTFRRKLMGLLDDCQADHLSLETAVMSSPAVGVTRVRQTERMGQLLAIQFEGIDRLIGDDGTLYREAAALLRGHPIYRDVFLQSAVVAQRQSGVSGGTFGFRFRRMVFERPDIGYSAYAQMLNQALLDLPLCRSMRALADGISREIRSLPEGARVLGLGCGPATEVLSLPPPIRERLVIELQDADPTAVAHVKRHAGSNPPAVGPMNPDEFASDDAAPGASTYSLIYAPFALASMPVGYGAADAAARFVRGLFDRLAPGGRLILASPFVAGPANPYGHAHRMLLEGEEAVGASHRSPAELIDLTSLLPDGGFRAVLTAEDMVSDIDGSTVMGVLKIDAP
jgi:SAM-dependent methyltransferase